MLATDEDAVICDFAETYHVLDYRALDLPLAATLAAGLAPDSRIMRKLRGEKPMSTTVLLAAAVDNLAVLRWLNSADGAKNINYPQSILADLTGEAKKTASGNIKTFATGADFDAYRAKLLQKVSENHGE